MADPTTSTKPVALAGADPWTVSGVGAIVRGLKNIADWIGGLVPAGASVYDTGHVTTGLTFGTQGTWTVTSYDLVRRGQRVSGRIAASNSASITSNINGTVTTNNAVCTMPSGWFSTALICDSIGRVGASYGLNAFITTAGVLTLNNLTAGSITTSAGFVFKIDYEL